jgi:hypothetical protein
MTPRPEVPLTVKRNRVTPGNLGIIAVSKKQDSILIERTGETLPYSELANVVRRENPSLFVVQGAATMLHELHSEFQSLPNWQYRVSPVKRDLVKPNGVTTGRRVVTTVVSMFGFTAPERSKKRGHFHHALDPWVFSRWEGIHGLTPRDDTPELVRLLRWASDVRDWCDSRGLRVTASSGGLANQLLRHSAFWPDARRKVPRDTNDVARKALPGNHYRLFGEVGKPYQATYLDMRSAHHHLAAEIAFPDPDSLYRRGPSRELGTEGTGGTGSRDSMPCWTRFGSERWHRLTQCHGLLLLRLAVPKIPAKLFPPPWAERPGTVYAFVYTNELPLLHELGVRVDYCVNAWVSRFTASGLNRYAEFALSELDAAEAARKLWLKGTLLATYGMLAARPRIQEFGFHRAKGGEDKQYPAGPGYLPVKAKATKGEREIPVANVIYRGMIEAECRLRSLAMARDLTRRGCRVLGVYADSVFVESHVPLPLLPHPWRVEAYLDRLRFLSPTAFTSVQMVKLPGIPRDQRDREEMIRRVSRSVR